MVKDKKGADQLLFSIYKFNAIADEARPDSSDNRITHHFHHSTAPPV